MWKRRPSVPTETASAPASATVADGAVEAQLAAARVREAELLKLLGQWASLAEVQQRVLHSMRNEVTMTSGFVETYADAIGTRFRELAGAARNQTDRVGSLVALAGVIEVDGEEVPLSGVTGLLTETLNDIVAKIIFLSRNAMSMVFAMDNVTKDLAAIERCINDVDKINKQTNMLALNAMIEATRAGEAGVAFRVVANEVQEVSKAVRGLAQTMRTEVGTIAQGIRDGHTILQELATVDMSPNIMAKDKLDQLVAALLQRDQTTELVVKDISRKAEEDLDGYFRADHGNAVPGPGAAAARACRRHARRRRRQLEGIGGNDGVETAGSAQGDARADRLAQAARRSLHAWRIAGAFRCARA